MLVVLTIAFVFVVNLLTSLIKNVHWDWRGKAALAAALSTIGGVLALYLTGGVDAFTTSALFTTITSVFGTSQLIYQFIMRGSPVEEKLANSLNKPKEGNATL